MSMWGNQNSHILLARMKNSIAALKYGSTIAQKVKGRYNTYDLRIWHISKNSEEVFTVLHI